MVFRLCEEKNCRILYLEEIVFFSVDCALGYYSVDKRQCIACGAGFYLSTGNRDGCDACPVGTNSQKTGLTRQLDCFRKYCFFLLS